MNVGRLKSAFIAVVIATTAPAIPIDVFAQTASASQVEVPTADLSTIGIDAVHLIASEVSNHKAARH